MSATDRTLLVQLFDEDREKDFPALSDSEFFEIYVPYHYLKGFELDYSDIENGIVDGPKDGGIDAFFTLVDGRQAADVELASVRKGPTLDVFVFSTKYINSFKTGTLADIRTTLNDLLTLDDARFISQSANYNIDLVVAMNGFRTTYRAIASRFPKLRITVVYGTASSNPPTAEITTRLEALAEDLRDQFSDAQVHAEAADAKAVLAKVREVAEQVRPLEVSGNSVSLQRGPSYICLAKLEKFYEFIITPTKSIEQRLFDDNVRDWEGDVKVNKEIAKTLESATETDFWWLNNGVSIICDNATLSGNTLLIKNPKIVNGLQTSRQLFAHFAAGGKKDDDRHILVRVVSAEDENVRASIIRATNRQTPILPAQLVATSEIHKNIELFLRGRGIYYERRKNHWKNLGKSRSEIVTVTDLAQAMIALVAGKPHVARARPGSLLNTEADQELIFSESYNLAIYEKVVDLVRSVDAQILEVLPQCGRRDRNNIKFQVAAKIVYESCGQNFGAERLLSASLISPEMRAVIIQMVYEVYVAEGMTDAVAKSEDFWLTIREA